jgi:hypothetical protein
MAVSIPLTQGKTALVDDEDGDLAVLDWYAHKNYKTFYAERTVSNRTQCLHQVIAARIGISGEVDHRDRNGLNNQRSNLRAATASQNGANRTLRSDNKSGVKGVSWNKRHGKWYSQIRVNGRLRHLGSFDNLKLAEAAVQKAREQAFGEYACHG